MTALQGDLARAQSTVLAMWRSGRRDAVEATLLAAASVPRWRLMLEAVRFVRRFEGGGRVGIPPAASLRERAILLDTIITLGPFAAARAYAAATREAAGLRTGLAGLWTMVEHAPDDAAPADFADDPARDVQVVARPGARHLVLVFTGGAHRFNAPLDLAHRWFGRLDASIAYLRDFEEMHYLGGIRSLGDGRGAALRGLRRIAASLGASRIVCTGSSSGSYGAMGYALDLAADRVLCLAGPSVLDEGIPQLLARERRRGGAAEPVDTRRLDLAPLYAAAERRPRLRILFGGDNPYDRHEAENMARVPGVDLVPLAGVSEHGVLPALVGDGAFDRHLDWLVPDRPAQRAIA